MSHFLHPTLASLRVVELKWYRRSYSNDFGDFCLLQFLNISDATTSTPSRCLRDDPMLSVILDTPAISKNAPRFDSGSYVSFICAHLMANQIDLRSSLGLDRRSSQ